MQIAFETPDQPDVHALDLSSLLHPSDDDPDGPLSVFMEKRAGQAMALRSKDRTQ